MSVGNRRRSATTACLALCCLYLVLSLVDRRRELLRRAQAKLDQEVQNHFDETAIEEEEREMLRGPAKVMPGDPRLIKIIKSVLLKILYNKFLF